MNTKPSQDATLEAVDSDDANIDTADVLEGKRVLPINSFGYRIIGVIAFIWSCFQIYVVIAPFNDVFVR